MYSRAIVVELAVRIHCYVVRESFDLRRIFLGFETADIVWAFTPRTEGILTFKYNFHSIIVILYVCM